MKNISYKPKRILITGGGGFLGINLTQRLIEFREKSGLSFEIVSMDLLPSPIKGVQHIRGSILDTPKLSSTVHGADVVVHLAALLGVENTEKRRLDCLQINIEGTINILNVCALEKVKKVVYASSSEVYGDQVKLPISEANPVNPKSIYAVTKIAGEEYVRAYAQRYGFDYSILRFFNAYGLHQVGQFVISRFVKAVLEDQSPMLSGDGGQVRAFCFGSDIADGIIASIFSSASHGEIINLGNDKEPVTMKQLAKLVIRVSGKNNLEARIANENELDRKPERDIRERRPDISKARRILDFEPQVTLENGIRQILDVGTINATWSE